MPRPKCCRKVGCMPDTNYFRPRGAAASHDVDVVLSLDEFEAVRLADLEGLYQEQAAVRMGISRQTFGRIIESARAKLADVVVNGKSLRIEGGEVAVEGPAPARCRRCRRVCSRNAATGEASCPHCAEE
jgi:uncharacterized protein